MPEVVAGGLPVRPVARPGSCTHMNDTSSSVTADFISIVVPAYNEADGIAEFNRRLCDGRVRLAERSEVIYVNDVSRDDTFAILRRLRKTRPTIAIIQLSDSG